MGTSEVLERLARFVQEQDAGVAVSFTRNEYVVGAQWGEEAPDSPMAGAAAYGVDAGLPAALDQMLSQAGY